MIAMKTNGDNVINPKFGSFLSFGDHTLPPINMLFLIGDGCLFGASPPVIGAAGDPIHDPEIPSRHVNRWFFWVFFSLLGGFKHFLFSIIYGIILPID